MNAVMYAEENSIMYRGWMDRDVTRTAGRAGTRSIRKIKYANTRRASDDY